ncbi:auxin efflux carrier [Mycena rebaudengoi]|nr:auxin efflux carrier [Mycena rebaudengoi]
MVAAGTLIWISAAPLLRLIIPVAGGFVVTKLDLFPQAAAGGMGQIILNITQPCLMFSRIISAFTAQNISGLGPIMLIAAMYQAIGVGIALIIKQLFWVPHRFRWGIFVAGGWGNYGDISTPIAMSIMGAAPFKGAGDQALSVAYISAMSFYYMITLFPLGGHKLIALDFKGPDIDSDSSRDEFRRRRFAIFSWFPKTFSRVFRSRDLTGGGEVHSPSERKLPDVEVGVYATADNEIGTATYLASSAAASSTAVTALDTQSLNIGLFPKETGDSELALPTIPNMQSQVLAPSQGRILWRRTMEFVKEVCSPSSLSVIVALPIAVVPALKGLFIAVDNSPIHPGPDGLPPLSFLFETAIFIGAASVPLGLVCLGSALARLEIPRGQLNKLSVGAITSITVGRMVVTPVLGVLLTKGLVHGGVIPEEDKVLQFVSLIFSCIPSGVNQVFLTQVYSGDGSAEHPPAFLLPQYAMLLFSMTGVVAYSLTAYF